MSLAALNRHDAAPYLAFAAGASAVALLWSLSTQRAALANFASPSRINPAPRPTPAEAQTLAYPPQGAMPGARDVASPYGTTRVYEFGPASSQRRVLLLHGISTPSVALAGVAHALAARGARVMLLDLFGRGWSDGPADLPYDGRLYASQVLLALASSAVPWTGGGARFALAGYSLGGGLAADFASWFPELVDELVLITPGGLLRETHISWASRFAYFCAGLVPERWSEGFVAERLRSSPNVAGHVAASWREQREGDDGENIAPAAEAPKNAVVATQAGEIDIEAVVDWQIDNHPGYLKAYVSSIRFAPIQRQHERWATIGRRAAARMELLAAMGQDTPQTADEARVLRQGLQSGKVLLLFGAKDKLVPADEVGPDAEEAIGKDNTKIIVFPDTGHELPITHSKEVADAMWNSWTSF